MEDRRERKRERERGREREREISGGREEGEEGGGECVKVIHENERCYQLQFEDEFLVHGHTFGFKVWYVHPPSSLSFFIFMFDKLLLSFY